MCQCAGMVELVDTSDLGSDAENACGFESHYLYHSYLDRKRGFSAPRSLHDSNMCGRRVIVLTGVLLLCPEVAQQHLRLQIIRRTKKKGGAGCFYAIRLHRWGNRIIQLLRT